MKPKTMKPKPKTPKQMLRLAMDSPERWVLRIEYDTPTEIQERIISPYRNNDGLVLALCLCRAESRYFHLNKMLSIALVPASDVMIPTAMVVTKKPSANDCAET